MVWNDAAPDSVLKTHGRSFHFARRFLGPRHGQRATRLYAFCRLVDDVADEAISKDAAISGLSRLEEEISGQRAAGRNTSDFLQLVDETQMDIAPALSLIDGVRSDLGDVLFETERDLIRYAYHVAGTVGLMMRSILDVDDPSAAPFAIDLGIAMQLTNIARDVGEDARMGRRYLPSAWVGDIPPEEIAAPDMGTQAVLKSSVKHLLALADQYYQSGEAGLAYLPVRARFAILIAGRVYGAIGRAIERLDFETWRAPGQTTGPEKTAIASRAALDFLTARALHRRDAHHDERLHLNLEGLSGAHVAT